MLGNLSRSRRLLVKFTISELCGDRQTDEQTDEQMDRPVAWSRSRCRERRLNKFMQTKLDHWRSCAWSVSQRPTDQKCQVANIWVAERIVVVVTWLQVRRRTMSKTLAYDHERIVVVVDFIDGNEKASRKNKKKKHCCQIAKIQQTHIKVQSHKITITKRNSN